ncbi:methylated-DNA--[protein]-cysteine S-methyltransferase [Pseudidiomarina homiensis]|uniref:Methylated-DNA--protein-cysteine methyltransferase n=1 Tax=Pseudidiomarina homiensis TaxID=364198 RepID=A0A432XXW3_9GAMM|nr:methylated-DNA--[protein]-cysteine S-methyltransferase [Pseudidiomarina homiensis]RUO53605.1 cysteine methyltransferase [Pseudidiomarina homiensis]
MYQAQLSSPLGPVVVSSDGDNVTAIEFGSSNRVNTSTCRVLNEALRQLEDYFGGRRKQFDLPLKPSGTEFQQRVWQALTQVPFGQTASYAAIADAIHNPKGVRAVGMANSKNPIAIVVPCHRIIGADGSLTGYAGGLEKKEWLLQHEGCHWSK